MAHNTSQLHIGATLYNGKYRIEAILGQGGFGITYLAAHIMLGRCVAIKEFFPKEYCSREGNTSNVTLGTSSNLEFVTRLRKKFVKEAQNIAKLTHPNIIKIEDIFEENGTAYYVMQYIDGESLEDMVKRDGAMPPERALKYMDSVARALQNMHGAHMMHLDIKPANIMVRRKDDTPILIDFGLSKEYNNAGDSPSVTINAVSHGYSPLEQYSSEGVKKFSPQTDIYALGGTLYRLVTGDTPPEASKRIELGLPIPESVNPGLRNLLEKTMAMARKDRPESMDKVLDLIANVEGTKKPEPKPEPNPELIKPDQGEETVINGTTGAGGNFGGGGATIVTDPGNNGGGKKKLIIIAVVCFLVAIGAALLIMNMGGNREGTASVSDSETAAVTDSVPAEADLLVDSAGAKAAEVAQAEKLLADNKKDDKKDAKAAKEDKRRDTGAAEAARKPDAPAQPAEDSAAAVRAAAAKVSGSNMDTGINMTSCSVSGKALVFHVALSKIYEADDCYSSNPVFRSAMNQWMARTPAASEAARIAKSKGYSVRFQFNGAKSFSLSY